MKLQVSKPLAMAPGLGLCLLVAAVACDRRRSQPPQESETSDSTIAQPAARATEAGREATASGSACTGLFGPALEECLAPERAGPAADRAAPVSAPSKPGPAEPQPSPQRAPER